MKLRVIYNSRLVPKNYGAWVLFPFMIFRDAKEDVDDQLFRHEMEHVYQVLRKGWFRFYIKYLFYSISRGYVDHPYEVAAHRAQGTPLTVTERHIKEKT